MTIARRSSGAFGALCACLPALAAGAEAAAGSADFSGHYLQAFAALVVVVALIGATAWVLKRAGPLAGARGPLRIVATQAVGARERVVVLELGDDWLVVGVAPGQVPPIDKQPRRELAAEPRVAPFAALLERARGRPPASRS